MFVLTQEGATIFLKYLLKITVPPNPYLHLIGSPHTVVHTDTLTSLLAVELPLASGYAPVQLTSPGTFWALSNLTAGANALGSTVPWTFTGALSVYGYWLSDDTNMISWGGETFTPSYTFPAGGGPFSMVPNLYQISCPGVSSC